MLALLGLDNFELIFYLQFVRFYFSKPIYTIIHSTFKSDIFSQHLKAFESDILKNNTNGIQ